MPLLKAVRSTLLTKIQQDWAQFFYHELEDVQAQLEKEKKGESFDYKEELKKLHESKKERWEKYLLPPRGGFHRYIEDLLLWTQK